MIIIQSENYQTVSDTVNALANEDNKVQFALFDKHSANPGDSGRAFKVTYPFELEFVVIYSLEVEHFSSFPPQSMLALSYVFPCFTLLCLNF